MEIKFKIIPFHRKKQHFQLPYIKLKKNNNPNFDKQS